MLLKGLRHWKLRVKTQVSTEMCLLQENLDIREFDAREIWIFAIYELPQDIFAIIMISFFSFSW